jgi:hypothetical protein
MTAKEALLFYVQVWIWMITAPPYIINNFLNLNGNPVFGTFLFLCGYSIVL